MKHAKINQIKKHGCVCSSLAPDYGQNQARLQVEQFSENVVRASKLTRSSNTAQSPLALLKLSFNILYQFNCVNGRRRRQKDSRKSLIHGKVRLGRLPTNHTAGKKQQN
jgi:hypothetical protein